MVNDHNAPHEFRCRPVGEGGAADGPWGSWQLDPDRNVFTGLVPDKTYEFGSRVKETGIRNPSEICDITLTVTLDSDTADPSWALGSAVTATSVGPTEVTLTWTGASDNAAIGSYKVYRDGALIGTPTSASHTATGLSPLTSYTFKVEAGDVVDRWTTDGPELTVSTSAPEPEEEEVVEEEPPAWLGGEMEVGVRHWTGSEDLEVRAAPGANSYVLEIMTSSLFSPEGDSRLIAFTGIGTVSIPSNMLVGTEHARSAEVSLTVGLGNKESLPEGLKTAVGDRPLIRLNLDVDGERVNWFNPEAPVSVTIPYTPTPEELLNPEAITVWYIDGSRNVVEVPSGRYDPATGTVTFSTTHFSAYAIVFVEKTFADLEAFPWAKKQVEALASKGIVKGLAAANDGAGDDDRAGPDQFVFLPDAEVTRADFLLMLARTIGLSAREVGSFADVPASAYYHDAVGIAKTLGITNGVDGVNFDPNSPITRQDMMSLAARALTAAGKLEEGNGAGAGAASLAQFSDAADIDSYALDSVASLVRSGLIAGDNGMMNPLGNTTRAEAAVFLYRVYNME